MMALDPSSFAQPDVSVVCSIDLDLFVDFDEKVVGGTAHLNVEKKSEQANVLVLDTNELRIESITDKSSGRELQYHLGEWSKPFGARLEISLPADRNKLTVSIQYKTSKTCSALQWLTPQQTAGKRQPYFFSQCQAIHARSLCPCQDTPSVKFTYTASVKAPKEITILMSAVYEGADPSEENPSYTIHHFKQKVPIPSYLLAIVGGDIESRNIGPRTKVWSERELVDRAAYEFAETEQMLKTAEELLGPYEWGQYDLLVLPPSFPFGGMENPCLTFVTPTLLAGDRSLADVVAHEISHSWTGNLVTNSTFEDFWLNEGHTVFVERKIASRLKGGRPLLQFLAREGWNTLRESVEQLKQSGHPDYSRLVPDLTGLDPDDVFSSVPYEKGFALLLYLEDLLGGPDVYEPFMRKYIEKFKFKSLNTQEWKDFLFSYFSSEEQQAKLRSVEWDMWFHGQGLPNIQPQFDTSLVAACEALYSRWVSASDDDLATFTKDDLCNMTALQKRELVSLLLQSKRPVSEVKLRAMDKLYGLSQVTNSEIQFRWLRLCLKVRWADSIERALHFVTEQGRMKFVRPLYRDLYQWEEARPAAIDNFLKHQPEMHSTTAKLVAKDLHLEN